jgi:hypothetical protein
MLFTRRKKTTMATFRHGPALAGLTLLLLLVAPSWAQPAAGAPTTAPSKVADDADAIFDKGKAAFEAGKTEQAYDLYRQVWALRQTHDIAGNLAQVELSLGKTRDAAEHIAYALAHYPPSLRDGRREKLTKVLDGLRPQLAVLRLNVSVSDAKVTIDGKPIGASPITDEVFVDPGPHVVQATLSGYKLAEARLDVPKGSSQRVTLELVKEADSPPVRRSVVPGAVLGGIAGAALVTGIGLYAGGRAKDSSAHATHDAILNDGHTCVSGAADPRCAGLESTASTAYTLQKAGVGVLIGAGAATVGTVLYFVLPGPKPSPSGSGALRITPAVSPATAGLVFSGSF